MGINNYPQLEQNPDQLNTASELHAMDFYTCVAWSSHGERDLSAVQIYTFTNKFGHNPAADSHYIDATAVLDGRFNSAPCPPGFRKVMIPVDLHTVIRDPVFFEGTRGNVGRSFGDLPNPLKRINELDEIMPHVHDAFHLSPIPLKRPELTFIKETLRIPGEGPQTVGNKLGMPSITKLDDISGADAVPMNAHSLAARSIDIAIIESNPFRTVHGMPQPPVTAGSSDMFTENIPFIDTRLSMLLLLLFSYCFVGALMSSCLYAKYGPNRSEGRRKRRVSDLELAVDMREYEVKSRRSSETADWEVARDDQGRKSELKDREWELVEVHDGQIGL